MSEEVKMKSFVVYSAEGRVLRTGVCNEDVFDMQADANAGETVVEGVSPAEPAQVTYSWRANRMREYPPLQQLADALYWSQKGNPTLLDAYLAACEDVKRKYPKE
ncbi:MAG: hypothetical protein ACO29C_01535 [Fluviibacter sp.]